MLQQTDNKQCENNLSTAYEQICKDDMRWGRGLYGNICISYIIYYPLSC